MVDWSRTRAWSEGGYYARVFLNVKGREPHGLIEPEDYQSERDILAAALGDMRDHNGRSLANRVLKPDLIYRSCESVPPDLMLYIDDLRMRSLGTVGGEDTIFQMTNDTGPDDANHHPDGIFILTRMGDLRRGLSVDKKITGASLEDIAPTILQEYGITAPDLHGKALTLPKEAELTSDVCGAYQTPTETEPLAKDSAKGYTSEEEELVKKRLADLGVYLTVGNPSLVKAILNYK